MALLIGVILGLFAMFALALLGAGFRNPRWLVIAVFGIIALYQFGENKLVNDLENITITADGSAGCPVNHVQMVVTNGGPQSITRLAFSLRGFKPNYSNHIAYAFFPTYRIVPPGQSWTNCWEVKDLRKLTGTEQSNLRWDVQISSVGFAE